MQTQNRPVHTANLTGRSRVTRADVLDLLAQGLVDSLPGVAFDGSGNRLTFAKLARRREALCRELAQRFYLGDSHGWRNVWSPLWRDVCAEAWRRGRDAYRTEALARSIAREMTEAAHADLYGSLAK